MSLNQAPQSQKGFTIVELMIATAVLSTMLVLVTVVMVNIGSLYYKGINQSKVQGSVRTIADDIVRNVQLSDQPPIGPVSGPNSTQAYCIGTIRYTFVLGVQIGHGTPPNDTGTPYQHVLWRDKNPTPGTCAIGSTDPSPVNLTQSTPSSDPNGAELIADNSRLTEFSITTAAPAAIVVAEAYGDNDLLCNPTAVSGSCNNESKMPQWANYSGNILCKGLKGQQFCSTARLNTAAVSRL